MKFKSAAGSLVLVATAFIWGISFVAQTRGMEHVGPLTFNAARSVLACAALFLSALMLPQTGSRKAALPAGILCGLILSVANCVAANRP